MNLDAVVTKGCLPWKPNADVRDLAVWHQYEHPHVGTFVSQVGTVLFAVVGGIETDVSVWAYACLTPGEARKIDGVEFGSVDQMQEFVERIMDSHRLVLALADDLLIVNWTVAEETGPLYEVATGFLEQLLMDSRSRQDPGERFRATLAQVDATRELIEA